jgi:hypothetical protein
MKYGSITLNSRVKVSGMIQTNFSSEEVNTSTRKVMVTDFGMKKG